MFLFALGLILLGLAIGSLFYARRLKRSADPSEFRQDALRTHIFWTKIGAWVVIGLAVLCITFSVTFRVGSKEFAVLTTYGKVNGNYGSGIHFRAPWQKSNTVDGKQKTFGFAKDADKAESEGFDKTYTCIPAQLGNGPSTCVDATIRWQITEDQAGTTYQNFGSGNPTDHFGQAVVRAQFLQVIPNVVRTYNPIANLKVLKDSDVSNQVTASSFAPDYDALSKLALEQMQSRMNGEADIKSVTISQVPLDSTTQQKLSQFIQEQANTRTAAQKVFTNAKLAEANKNLEDSLEKSPGLLVKQCLDEVEAAQQGNYSLPPTFNCNLFGGQNGSQLLINTPSSQQASK